MASEQISLAPSPQTTLVIVLGASQWPYDPVEFPADKAFEEAAEKIERYFTQSFGISEGNILQLFNTDHNAIEIEKEIYKYLEKEKFERSARDVIIYYVGHAKRTNKHRQLYLAIKDTHKHNPEGTSLKVESLARTVQMQTRGLRRFYIFDCCFSANAIPDLQGPKETDLLQYTLEDVEGKTQGFTALFSSSMSEASVILPNHTNTFFTEALLQVLLASSISSNRPLSFNDVYDEINLRLRTLYKQYLSSYPTMEEPPYAQIYPGDIAKVPLFPNLGFQQEAHRSNPAETNQASTQEQIPFTYTPNIKVPVNIISRPTPPLPHSNLINLFQQEETVNKVDRIFEDRREAIALFEHLCGRDPNKPWPLLPILVFFAPGGSGKSKLLEYLRTEKCCLPNKQVAIPHAQIDFTQAYAPKNPLTILVTLRNLLLQQRDEYGRYLTFPRFDLGASIVLAMLSTKELQSNLTLGTHLVEPLADTGDAIANIADLVPAPFNKIPTVIRALLTDLKLTAQIPDAKEIMQHIESGLGWRWYQTNTSDPGLQARNSIQDVLLRLQSLSTPGNPGQDYLIKEVLPAAFLADLFAVLVLSDPPCAWSRTTNVVLFLDGFEDLLDNPETSSMAVQLLEALTLSEHRIRRANDPLLLVIGSRQPSLLKFANMNSPTSVGQQTAIQAEPSIEQRVRELHQSWQQKIPDDRSILELGDLYLPLPLQDFGWDDTQRYLAHLDKKKQTFTDRKLVEAIHRVTHGHPLSLALAAAAFLQAEARGRILSMDKFVEEAVSSKVVPGHSHESIEAYLLDLFLRQLPASVRSELIFCAVPRFLDANIVRVILRLPTDRKAQELWKDYQRFTFVGVAGNERIIFHPIVRSLLLRLLLTSHEPESDYYQIHTCLREYFHTWAMRGNEQAQVEEAYHALALGDVEPAVNTGIYAQRVNLPLWEPLLDAVIQAPAELNSADMMEQLEYRRPHYDLQQSVRAIILYSWLLTTFHGVPEKAALLQRNIGRIYCDLQGGDQQVNLRRAIDHFEIALEVYKRENFPAEWATTQLDLGEAYSLLRGKDRQTTKHKALNCYKTALQVCTEQTFPTEWARAKNNLGEALSDVPGENRQANLQEAITYYKEALRIRTQAEFPYDWAITQNNLGNAYAHLLEGNQEANLQDAIACYKKALSEHIQENYPVEWAREQNNLGNAYRNLAQKDQAGRQTYLQDAIDCYKLAFQIRTQQGYPVDWAATQHNLGLAYSFLSGQDENKQQEDFKQATDCFQEALKVYTLEAYPIDWAKIQNALGNVYRYKPEKDEDKKRENLQRAISYFKAALQIYTQENFPEAWARMRYNLGLAYAHMQEKEKKDRQANLQEAIACYEAALKIYTPETHTEDWAKIQNALGNAYRLSPLGNQQKNLQIAIAYYGRAIAGYHSILNDDDAQKVKASLGMARSKLAKMQNQNRY